jgi:hypothetical protein
LSSAGSVSSTCSATPGKFANSTGPRAYEASSTSSTGISGADRQRQGQWFWRPATHRVRVPKFGPGADFAQPVRIRAVLAAGLAGHRDRTPLLHIPLPLAMNFRHD